MSYVSKNNANIDVALTKQHHNYYGEEADPELANFHTGNKNKQNNKPSPKDSSNSDDEAVYLFLCVTEVRNAPNGEDQNLPMIGKTNDEIVE